MNEFKQVWLAIVLALGIVAVSAKVANCYDEHPPPVQLVPGALCWLEPFGMTHVQLFAESPDGILELPILSPMPLPVTGDYEEGFCASTIPFPQRYEIYLIGWYDDGKASPESNRMIINNAQ